jgi:hypothetical protein
VSRQLAQRAGSALPPIGFYLPADEPHAELARLDPDRDWVELQRGDRAWILQTYLRLAAAGLPVELVDRPRATVLVYHASAWRRVEREGAECHALLAVRGDLRPAANAELEVVQNPRAADGRRRFFVPHWPQPGLLPRDPARGATVRVACFKGVRESLHPDLATSEWQCALETLGVEWRADAVEYHADDARRARLRWPDYRDVDVLVALRPPSRSGHPHKPPTKLFNAWLAGVPAVLGREQAYQAMRRSELDYLEATSPRQALAAVARLATDPDLYRAMVAQGARRAEAVTVPRLVEAWRELLFETVPGQLAAVSRHRSWPRAWRWLAGRARRRLAPR